MRDQLRAAQRFVQGRPLERYEWKLAEGYFTTHAPNLTEGLFKSMFDSPFHQRAQTISPSGIVDRLRGRKRSIGPSSRPSDKVVYHTDSNHFSGLINGKRFTNYDPERFHDHLTIDHGFGHKEAHEFAARVVDHAQQQHYELAMEHAKKAMFHGQAMDNAPNAAAQQHHAHRAIHHWEHAEKLGLNTHSYSPEDLKDHKSFFHRWKQVKAEESALKKQQGF